MTRRLQALARGLRTLAGICLVAMVWSNPVEAQSAKDTALASIDWLKGFDCPVPGYQMEVPGVTDTKAQKASNFTFASQSVSTIQQARQKRAAALYEVRASGRPPSRKFNEKIAELDAGVEDRIASTSTALVQWVLADWIETSGIDPSFNPSPGQRTSQHHPLSTAIGERSKLSGLISQLSDLPSYGALIAPILPKMDTCLTEAQAAIVEANASSINSAVARAKTPAEIDQILLPYMPVSTSWGADKPTAIFRAEARRQELVAVQQQTAAEAAERARAQQRQQQAAREAKRQAAVAKARQNLPSAQRLVQALRSKHAEAALSLMSETIVMSSSETPTRRGKSAVRQALRERFASSDPAPSIGAPKVSADARIYSIISASQGSATMTIMFDSLGRVSKIDTRRR